MPILYMVNRDTYEHDDVNGEHETHFWLRTKADALEHAKQEAGRLGVWAKAYRVNIPSTKRGMFMALRIGDSPELLEKYLGRDKVQMVAAFHSGTRMDPEEGGA